MSIESIYELLRLQEESLPCIMDPVMKGLSLESPRRPSLGNARPINPEQNNNVLSDSLMDNMKKHLGVDAFLYNKITIKVRTTPLRVYTLNQQLRKCNYKQKPK